MAKQYKYVVKRIVNKKIAPRGVEEYVTWDVYKEDLDGSGFEFFAEFENRANAILVAKAVNLYKNRAFGKCLRVRTLCR